MSSLYFLCKALLITFLDIDLIYLRSIKKRCGRVTLLLTMRIPKSRSFCTRLPISLSRYQTKPKPSKHSSEGVIITVPGTAKSVLNYILRYLSSLLHQASLGLTTGVTLTELFLNVGFFVWCCGILIYYSLYFILV